MNVRTNLPTSIEGCRHWHEEREGDREFHSSRLGATVGPDELDDDITELD